MRISQLKSIITTDDWLSSGDRIAIALTSYEIDEWSASIPRILWLSVDDVNNPYKKYAFKPEDAKAVIEHIQTYERHQPLHEVICACDGGVSRSAALCASLMMARGMDDTVIWRSVRRHPNELVYATMRDALGLPVSQGELDFKQELNKKAHPWEY